MRGNSYLVHKRRNLWNIEKQLEFFRLKWTGNEEFALGRGNNRVTRPINTREVYFVGKEEPEAYKYRYADEVIEPPTDDDHIRQKHADL